MEHEPTNLHRVVHRLCHSRTPFSAAKIIDLTGVAERDARSVALSACGWGWSWKLGPDTDVPEGLDVWKGKL